MDQEYFNHIIDIETEGNDTQFKEVLNKLSERQLKDFLIYRGEI